MQNLPGHTTPAPNAHAGLDQDAPAVFAEAVGHVERHRPLREELQAGEVGARDVHVEARAQPAIAPLTRSWEPAHRRPPGSSSSKLTGAHAAISSGDQ